MSINKVMISGNLTRDPEPRNTPSGMSVLQFDVAVNDRRKNAQTGQWEDAPNYVTCVMFGARADGVARFLTKGTKVAIEGKLRWSQWEDKNTGAKRSKLDVVVDEIEFLSPRNAGDQGQSFSAPAAQSYNQGYAPAQQQGGYQQQAYQPQGYQPQGGYQPAYQQAQPYAPAAAPVQSYQPQAQPQGGFATGGFEAPSQDAGESFGSAARGAYRDMPAAPTADAYADEDIPF